MRFPVRRLLARDFFFTRIRRTSRAYAGSTDSEAARGPGGLRSVVAGWQSIQDCVVPCVPAAPRGSQLNCIRGTRMWRSAASSCRESLGWPERRRGGCVFAGVSGGLRRSGCHIASVAGGVSLECAGGGGPTQSSCPGFVCGPVRRTHETLSALRHWLSR